MQYFERIDQHVDIQPLLDEIASIKDAWALASGRQNKVTVQRESNSVPLRGIAKSKTLGRRSQDVHESRATKISRKFPVAVAWLEDFAQRQQAQLGRAKIVRLPPGAHAYPHVDRGEYYEVRDRYHLVLKSLEGSPLRSADETALMREAELWWFDNKQFHEAWNTSEEDRIHLIFDL